MKYRYRIYGLICSSEIEMPDLIVDDSTKDTDFEVILGKVEPTFKLPPNVIKPFAQFNEAEFYYQIPELARFFVSDGKKIVVEPLCSNWKTIQLYIYSNCMTALLFQNNLIPFHVSGVVDKEGGLWLISAPSRYGKSTTAVKLKERGYRIFTDDTSVLSIQDNKVLATPSYPMLRIWDKSLKNQSAFEQEEAILLRENIEKYAIQFHDQFIDEPTEVKGIFFIEMNGNDIKIEKMKAKDGMEYLGNNIFKISWISGMNKNLLQHKIISSISPKIPFWKATRPKNQDSFDTFADAIHTEISMANGK